MSNDADYRMKTIILTLLLSLMSLMTLAQAQNIIKLSAGWYSLNDAEDENSTASDQISFSIEYQHIWTKHFGIGIRCERLDDECLFSPDLLYRFSLPVCQKEVNLTAFAGCYSLELTEGFYPSTHCGAELDVPLSSHWGIGIDYRLVGFIGATVNNFGASLVYSF